MAPIPVPLASACFRCQQQGSSPQKFMLQCCECRRTWHHSCHIPPVSEKDLIDGIKAFNADYVENIFTMWMCRKCGKKAKTDVPTSAANRLNVASDAPTRRHAAPNARPAPSTSHANPATVAPVPMDVDDYNDDIIIVDSPPMPRMRTETAATSKPRPPINTTHSDPQLVTRAIPSKVRLDDSDKLPPTSSTLATSPSGGSTVRTAEQHTREAGRLPGPGQVNPFAARLAGGVTTSKRTTSRKGSKAAVPLLPAPPNPAFTEHPTLEPARPPLYTKGSTSIATSSASSFRRTATSQRERTVTPQLSDGTVTDLGDKLEEMNVDAPEPVADPDLPPSTHRQPSADTSVPYTRVSPAALPRPLLSPLDEAIQRLHSAKAPLSSSRPTIVKGPIPGESLAFEWLTLRPHGPAEGRLDKESKTIRRPRKAAAKFRGGRSLDRELLNISMHSAKI